jgi:molecular chaperone Hsp33
MNRYLRGLCGEASDVAFIIADTTDLVKHATILHETSSVASAAFGRTLTACGLMSLFLKGEKANLSLQIKGSNLIKNIFTYGDSHGRVKGYITTPDVGILYNEAGKLDVGFAVGSLGKLNVIKDFGFGTPYIGQSDLVSGEIAEDLAAYYMHSEQQPIVVALGVHVNTFDQVDAAGGLMIQTLPDVSDASIDALERRVPTFEPLTGLLLEGLTLEACLDRYFGDVPYRVLEEGKLEYACDCNKERTSKALISLGELDLNDMIASGEPAELHCHFCGARYHYDQQELTQLLYEALSINENENDV